MCGSPKKKTVAKRQCIISVNSKNVQVELNQGANLTYNTGFDDSSFLVIISVTYLLVFFFSASLSLLFFSISQLFWVGDCSLLLIRRIWITYSAES